MRNLPKVALPTSHPYLSNKYTNWYYSIIVMAQNRQDQNLYVETHHIIPDCFFVVNRSNGKRPGYLEGDANSPSNLVKLTFKEHFICHWLLTKMVKGLPYFQMENALSIFRRLGKGQPRIMSAGQYARIRQATAISNQGKNNPSYGNYWWTDGTNETKAPVSPGPSWRKGRSPRINDILRNHKPSSKGENNPGYRRYLWTDGTNKIRSKIAPDGWYRIKDQPIWWHIKSKRIETQSVDKPEGTGWARGKLPTKPHGLKGAKWWHTAEGLKKLSHDCPGNGWSIGKDRL